MARGQPDERAAGQRIGVRAALAGRYGRKSRPSLPGRHVGRPSSTRSPNATPGRQRVAEPAQAAGRRQHHRHHVPPPGHGVAERVDAAVRARTAAGRSRRRRRRTSRATAPSSPATTTPTPTALAAWSPPPATTGVPARSPVAAAAAAVTVAGDLRSLERRRQPAPGRCRARRGPRATSRARPGRTGSCPAPSALSMACSPVRRRRT